MSKKNKKDGAAKTSRSAVKAEKRESVFGNPIRNLIITAVVSILLGVAFLVKPQLVYTYCGFAIGGLIGLAGLVYIIIYFFKKPVSGDYRYEFGFGLVALLAGAYVALGGYLNGSGSTGGIGFAIILKILGILVSVDGILKLQYTLDLARMKYPRWWLGLIFSLLGIGLGVGVILGFVYDFGGTLGLGSSASYTEAQNAFIGGMMLLGIALCVNGLLDLLTLMIVAIRNHKARREEAIAEGSAMVAAAQQEELDERIPETAPVVEVPAPVVEVPAPVVEEPAPAAPVIPEPVQATPASPEAE